QDLLLINSCCWPGFEGNTTPRLTLYHNKGNGTFEDVTEKMKLNVTLYGMGVAVGDYDNDGYVDVFITAVGGNRLFHNDKGQGFTDVTTRMGVGGPGGWPGGTKNFLDHKEPITFSTSATFLDYDGDGRLDLFVCNYVTWSPVLDKELGVRLDGTERPYAQPELFKGAQCVLYRNRDGKSLHAVGKETDIDVSDAEAGRHTAPP